MALAHLKVLLDVLWLHSGTLWKQRRTSRTSKLIWVWALHTLLAALPRYGWHCARISCNHAIITFLWHQLAYAIIPDPSPGGRHARLAGWLVSDLYCGSGWLCTLHYFWSEPSSVVVYSFHYVRVVAMIAWSISISWASGPSATDQLHKLVLWI